MSKASQIAARRLFPLKDRRQFLAPERGVSGGFVPRDVCGRIFGFAFWKVLIHPTARPRQTSAVFEFAYRFFPCEFAPALDDRMAPELALQITSRADELLV